MPLKNAPLLQPPYEPALWQPPIPELYLKATSKNCFRRENERNRLGQGGGEKPPEAQPKLRRGWFFNDNAVRDDCSRSQQK